MTHMDEREDRRHMSLLTGWRRSLYRQLDPTAWDDQGLSPLNRALACIIVLSVITALLDSEPSLSQGRESLFGTLELMFGGLFLLEYLARLWTSAESPHYGPGLSGKLKYVRSPAAILDFLALLPLILGPVGNEAYMFRLFRLARVLRLAKLGRFSSAMHSLSEAVRSRRYELLMSAAFAGLLLLVTSTLLYLVEGEAQPDNFGSIPRAMWWSIATLTTVGYGDVYPVTALGKVLAGLTAITGIGLIAMPTGILAAAFSDAMQRQRERGDSNDPN